MAKGSLFRKQDRLFPQRFFILTRFSSLLLFDAL